MSSAALATPTIGDCASGDAPTGFDTGTYCGGACTWDGTDTITCSLPASCATTPRNVTAVTDFAGAGSHEFSVWGECSVASATFCCVIDDDPTPLIDNVVLNGSTSGDDVFAQYATNGDYLHPHRASHSLTVKLNGGDGFDEIHGSPATGALYQEFLSGGNGNDDLYGYAGDDVLAGNDGNDWLEGGAGEDRLEGGAGSDQLFGGAGNDTLLGGPGGDDLFGEDGNDAMDPGDGADYAQGNDGNDAHCDTSEDSTATCTSNHFDDFGTGLDVFWLEFSAACAATGNLNVASHARTQLDACGDATPVPNGWGALPWGGCDNSIVVKPGQCP